MKNKSVRLKVVLDLNLRNEQAALEVLQTKRKAFDHHSLQLANLQEYHGQYLHDYRAALEGKVSAEQFHTFHNFISQLRVAIEHQEANVKQAESEFTEAKQAWALCHQKVKSMQDLIDKYRNQEELEEEKKTQKILEDQFTARRLYS